MNSMQILRGWAARHAQWLAIAGLFSAPQAMAANEYVNSPQVGEFITEMTRDYGFASEQLSTLKPWRARRKSTVCLPKSSSPSLV